MAPEPATERPRHLKGPRKSLKTGAFVDPRSEKEKAVVQLVPSFAAIILTPAQFAGNYEYEEQRFVMQYPQDTILVGRAQPTDDNLVHLNDRIAAAAPVGLRGPGNTFSVANVSEWNRLSIPDPTISRKHAIISFSGDRLAISIPTQSPINLNVPLTRLNGTRLDGELKHDLRPRDTLDFGHSSHQSPMGQWKVSSILYGPGVTTDLLGEFSMEEMRQLEDASRDRKWVWPGAVCIVLFALLLGFTYDSRGNPAAPSPAPVSKEEKFFFF